MPHVQPPVEPPYPGPADGRGWRRPLHAGNPTRTDGCVGPGPRPRARHLGRGRVPGLGTDGTDPCSGTWWMGRRDGGGLPPTAWPPAPYGYYPAPLPQPTAPKNHRGQVAVIASVVAVLALLLGASIGHATWPTATTAASTGLAVGQLGDRRGSQFPFGSGGSGGSSVGGSGSSTTGAGAPANVPGIAAKVSPALVDINTNLSYQNEQAAGTGIVLSSNGEVLTNNHVIDGATSISVTDIGNGQTYKANVVGYDRTGDIAVIQLVGASGLQVAKIAPSMPAVGEGVVGVGNAGGAGGDPSAAGGSVTTPQPGDHGQRQRWRELGEPRRPHRDELRHPAR